MRKDEKKWQKIVNLMESWGSSDKEVIKLNFCYNFPAILTVFGGNEWCQWERIYRNLCLSKIDRVRATAVATFGEVTLSHMAT
jgi:hypothetical protein